MKPVLWLLSVVAAFFAGSLLRPPAGPAVIETVTAASSVAVPVSQAPPTAEKRTALPRVPGEKPAAGHLKLSRETVAALMSGGTLEARLGKLGLDASQKERVAAVRREATEALKALEKRHSRQVSDARGDYVVVERFPAERAKWLAGIESSLRAVVDDDRAVVIADLISAADNDEDPGTRRREIFVTGPDDQGRTKVEERSFDDAGRHIDSDYELIDGNTRGRWGHLLE